MLALFPEQYGFEKLETPATSDRKYLSLGAVIRKLKRAPCLPPVILLRVSCV